MRRFELPHRFAIVLSLLLGSFARASVAATPEDSVVSEAGAPDNADEGTGQAELNSLLGALDTKDPGARQRAAESAQRLGERAVPVLIRAAHGLSREVARWATGELEALGRKVPGDAVQTKSNQVLSEVLEAYGDTRDADALPAVLSFVNSDHAQVRDAARRSILAYRETALTKLREVYANLTGHSPPELWTAAEVARELFASDDRFRLQEVHSLMDEGLLDERANDHEAAVATFEKILARQPLFDRRAEMVTAFVLAGQAREESNPAGAAAYYRTAIRLSSDGPRASQAHSALLYLEGEDLLARGITDENLFRLAASENPGHLKARAELARIEARRASHELKVRRYAEGGIAAAAILAAIALLPQGRLRALFRPHSRTKT